MVPNILLIAIVLGSHGMANGFNGLEGDEVQPEDGTTTKLTEKLTEEVELPGSRVEEQAPAEVLHGLRHFRADKRKAITDEPCTVIACQKKGKRAKRKDGSGSATSGSGKLPLPGDSEENNSSNSETSSEQKARNIFPPFHKQT